MISEEMATAGHCGLIQAALASNTSAIQQHLLLTGQCTQGDSHPVRNPWVHRHGLLVQFQSQLIDLGCLLRRGGRGDHVRI